MTLNLTAVIIAALCFVGLLFVLRFLRVNLLADDRERALRDEFSNRLNASSKLCDERDTEIRLLIAAQADKLTMLSNRVGR